MRETNFRLLKAGAILSMISIILLVILFQKILPAYASLPQIKVTATELNVREAADLSSKIIGLVHLGETFEIVQTKNTWDQIKLSSGQTGWVNSAYVTSSENIEATVKAPVLNVRENPGLSGKVLNKLASGAKVTIQEEQGGWVWVTSSSGIQGWVSSFYISRKPQENQPTQSVAAPVEKKGVSSEISANASDVHTTGLEGKTIVLDAGHGGIDAGTTSITGTPEKDLTLKTAQAVQQKLENSGAHVIMTRSDDSFISLQQRIDISNRIGIDAFISFHYNWSNNQAANGLTDFYYNHAKDSALAADLLNEVVKSTGLNKLNTNFDDLFVLRKNAKPSVLIELGFLSNKEDTSVAENADFHSHVAEGVYQGLLDYFSNKNS